MTFSISSVAFLVCGAFLQITHCVVVNPHPAYSNPAYPNPAYPNVPNALSDPLFNYKDILNYPPYSLYCDCDLSAYYDQYTIDQLNQIAAQYNQRSCDIQQLYPIIDSVMPTLPDQPYRMNMIASLARGLYEEQARRGLVNLPEYPGFCNSIYPDALPTLVKRSPEPIVDVPVVDVPSSLNPSSYSSNYMAYYYNMYYLMDRIMPHLSPQFQQDIKDSVYMNTRLPELGQAPELIRRLNSNLRTTVSEMFDYTPGYYY